MCKQVNTSPHTRGAHTMDQRCGTCAGIGEVQDMEVRQHGRYAMQWARCDACDGTGRVEAAALEPIETHAQTSDG